MVRNLPDGRVEAVFEGPSESVDVLVSWCEHGPTSAQVRRVRVVDEDPLGETVFPRHLIGTVPVFIGHRAVPLHIQRSVRVREMCRPALRGFRRMPRQNVGRRRASPRDRWWRVLL